MAARKTASSPATALSISPNPVQNKLGINLTAPNEGTVILSIINSQGQLLKTMTVSMAGSTTLFRTELDVSELPAGMYFIRATGRHLSTITKFEKTQ